MFVNDLVKTYGYTRHKLEHFTISIYNPTTDDWMEIKKPTADEYIHLCDRLVVDWITEDDDMVAITVYASPMDFDIFRKYLNKGV